MGANPAELNALRAALSPVERAALADKVLSHWAVWRQVNVEAKPGGREPGGRLAELAAELEPRPEQEEKISAALRGALARLAPLEADKVGGQVQRFAAAFAGESFDTTSVTTTTTATLTEHSTRHTALFYGAAAPLITPEQRALLASHLREHADHNAAQGAGR